MREKPLAALLLANPEIHLEFSIMLSKRLQYKAMMMKEMSSYDPEHRILSIVDYFGLKEPNNKLRQFFNRDSTNLVCGV